ncbi:23S rRNA (Uracil-5-)-methyltransferase [Cavenderia fasciculata]|uniref:23S rRNA (Uracil-5-)-methyltransferase n=1 Tax=Cavenderia fasciculata TaxID=261658 RepID=F4Q0J2_CACFS|nr:23S rRNA (Uracil-5-)-methyltransferase [Cavenderia fasciculata]EGG18343.1 23S rRNA (Uracil-5-)-methyltransferase [Cavenderia fasciculata]|eukprot:XP_004366247.1 23S rRNA (Uracil-5-)-methyltransferase [Cavenderia fasciculata]
MDNNNIVFTKVISTKYIRNIIFNQVRRLNRLQNKGVSIKYRDVDSLEWLLGLRDTSACKSLVREKLVKSIGHIRFPTHQAMELMCQLELDLFIQVYQHFKDDGIGRHHIILDSACKIGRLDIVQYLLLDQQHHPFTNHAIEYAARNGHLDCIKVLFGCGQFDRDVHITCLAYDSAAKGGHIEILQYYDSCFTIESTNNCIDEACKLNHEPIVRYLLDNRPDLMFSNYAGWNAVENANDSLYRLLLDHHQTRCQYTHGDDIFTRHASESPYVYGALAKGNLQAIKNLIAMGGIKPTLSAGSMNSIVASGNTQLLEYLVTEVKAFHYLDFTSYYQFRGCLDTAIRIKHVGMVKLVCKLFSLATPAMRMFDQACRTRDTDIIGAVYQKMRDDGTEFDQTITVRDTKSLLYLYNLMPKTHLFSIDTSPSDKNLLHYIIPTGNLQLFEYLLASPRFSATYKITEKTVLLAATNHQLGMIKLIFQYRKGMTVTQSMIRAAIDTNNLQMFRLFESKIPKNKDRYSFVTKSSFKGPLVNGNFGIFKELADYYNRFQADHQIVLDQDDWSQFARIGSFVALEMLNVLPRDLESLQINQIFVKRVFENNHYTYFKSPLFPTLKCKVAPLYTDLMHMSNFTFLKHVIDRYGPLGSGCALPFNNPTISKYITQRSSCDEYAFSDLKCSSFVFSLYLYLKKTIVGSTHRLVIGSSTTTPYISKDSCSNSIINHSSSRFYSTSNSNSDSSNSNSDSSNSSNSNDSATSDKSIWSSVKQYLFESNGVIWESSPVEVMSRRQLKQHKKQSKKDGVPTNLYQAKVTSYGPNFQGIAQHQDVILSNLKSTPLKVKQPLHIIDALKDEIVEAQVFGKEDGYYTGRTKTVLKRSPNRAHPLCDHYGLCNGYIPKQPNGFEYRRRARLRVHFNRKTNKIDVGYDSPKITSFQVEYCPVLVKELQRMPVELSKLIESLSIKLQIPSIEVTRADNITSFSIRVLEAPEESDRIKIQEFGKQHDAIIILQHGGPGSFEKIYPEHHVDMKYSPIEGITLNISPVDFMQVNANANTVMVQKVLDYLNLNPSDNCYDLYCGVGNFTIPMAKKAGSVIGFELSQELLTKLIHNVHLNNVKGKVQAVLCNLFTEDIPFCGNDVALENGVDATQQQQQQIENTPMRINKIVLDPPRSGAQKICRSIPPGLDCIVYVSCGPETSLVKDLLLLSPNYQVKEIKLLDMFAQTSKMEAIAYLIPK